METSGWRRRSPTTRPPSAGLSRRHAATPPNKSASYPRSRCAPFRRTKLGRHEIHECADFRREMPGLRVHEPDRLRRRRETVEHRDELAAGDLVVEIIIVQLGEAITGAGRLAHRSAVAERHVAPRA